MDRLLPQVLRRDREVFASTAERLESSPIVSSEDVSRVLSQQPDEGAVEMPPGLFVAEAVVLWDGRPSLLVQDDGFALPAAPEWRSRLASAESALQLAIRATGRIELVDHPLTAMAPFIGTGWFVTEDVIVTNRHVAEVFAGSGQHGFFFHFNPDTGRATEVRLDLKEEASRTGSRDVAFLEVLHIEAPAGPDMAFFRVRPDGPLPQPIALAAKRAHEDEYIATVGYPGQDPRVPLHLLQTVFMGGFAVKRLAPGQVMDQDNAMPAWGFRHDASTLKGSSGSVVVSLESGSAVGLHFAGVFDVANSAVHSDVLLDLLASKSIAVPAVPAPPAPPRENGEDATALGDRDGYQRDFLGDELTVPLPGDGAANAVEELRYRHFSVVLHQTRKLAICAACNIDGNELRRIPRSGTWKLDARIELGDQHGNELYQRNDYDRGHLVRRLDPVWGSREIAAEANEDTFVYTNAAPQHKRLNQRVWLGLEDYILDNADARDLRVSVFTGCIFDPGDPTHRGVQIPRQFWKVVAFVGAGGSDHEGELRASGYLMDQSHLIEDMPTEFAFGAFRTYQVSIARLVGQGVPLPGELVAADVLGPAEALGAIPLTSPEDARF